MSDLLERWRDDPIAFIESVLFDPETGKPFVLLPAEREFLKHAFQTNDDGRLLYPEQVFGAPKKSGKTGFAALLVLTTVLLFGGFAGEGYVLANDEEQAQAASFCYPSIVEASPLLMREAKITADKIVFPMFSNATINTVSSNYGSPPEVTQQSAASTRPGRYTSERSHRLWDEMMPPPTRKIALRLTVTYAGFEGESTMLLKPLQARSAAAAGRHRPARWRRPADVLESHTDRTVANREWIAEMRRRLRPNQFLRMIENRFVSGETTFIDMGSGTPASFLSLGTPGRQQDAADLRSASTPP